MPFVYKIDVLEALKAQGWTTYKLRTQHKLSETTIQRLRQKDLIDTDTLGKLCEMLKCQPGDILEYKSEPQPVEPTQSDYQRYIQETDQQNAFKEWHDRQAKD